jgi:hypothetical protein
MQNDQNGQMGQMSDAALLERLKRYLFGDLRGVPMPGRRPSAPPDGSMQNGPGRFQSRPMPSRVAADQVALDPMPGTRPDVNVPPGQRPDVQGDGWTSWGGNEGIPMPREGSGYPAGRDASQLPDVQSESWGPSWGGNEGIPMPRDRSGYPSGQEGSQLPDVQSGDRCGSMDAYIRANRERNSGRFNRER